MFNEHVFSSNYGAFNYGNSFIIKIRLQKMAKYRRSDMLAKLHSFVPAASARAHDERSWRHLLNGRFLHAQLGMIIICRSIENSYEQICTHTDMRTYVPMKSVWKYFFETRISLDDGSGNKPVRSSANN